jgi:amidohydrolase
MDQRVLVTAAASGIGREIARAFAANGAKVFVCDIDESSLETLATELPSLFTDVCDVSHRMEVERMVAFAAESLGGLDVLVNNAGISGPTAPVDEMNPEEWEKVVQVNLNGTFYVTHSAIPHLKKSAAGVIINMSSVAGRFGYPNRSPYATTKWGLIGFTKTLSIELGKFGIRANAILPGAAMLRRMGAMNTTRATTFEPVLKNLDRLIPKLEALYKDIHRHPELSMQETRTAGLAANWLRDAGYEVRTGVGKTGVIGLLRNGDGPTVMLRADMDALPVEEATGLPYASKVKMTREGNTVPVAHMCGHDMHVTWLAGAATLFAHVRDAWHGTLMAVFQPGEETAEGAQAMIDDGLFTRFPKPVVVLGQHVMVGPAGAVAGRTGAITSAADSLQIRMFGRGAHGSMPQSSIDPVVMAAATVMRLQTIVSREVAAAESAVVTVGALQAGTKENVIPDEAIIKLNVRTFDEGVRKRVLAAIERIVNAEAAASGAPQPPEITSLDHYPLNVNDAEAANRVVDAFRRHFPAERVRQTGPAPASEDFGSFGTEWHVPSVFWFVGGTDPNVYEEAKKGGRLNELPVNHSPLFAPVIHPTLRTGVETLVVATQAWLSA